MPAIHWTPLPLLAALESLEVNVSSPRSFIQHLTDFTYMCSSCSNDAFEVERLIALMWEVTTLTSSQAERMRLEGLIMRSRMETLSLEGSPDRAERAAEKALIELRMRGARSQLLVLVRNFGSFSRSWIRSLWCALSTPCPSSVIGSSERNPFLIVDRMEYLILPTIQTLDSGEILFCLEEEGVSTVFLWAERLQCPPGGRVGQHSPHCPQGADGSAAALSCALG
ncbi:putative ORF3 protein [Giant panda associated gemycircularvirus]|uniref:Putative ORF3 protein n=1 Tax=Giant panda associated gemycircularvirus TaxID=2016461 RepID=A0A220IGP0_9VIRU|nr:putative ORF3 protein [Giant panda associated gemycircularvirus]ASH99138.1 putative ORF3 protein [Giant panda associated gemycircularvirus]ASH99156.1 putative ORF3 protein [Giant panda associated gemycircularvirus]